MSQICREIHELFNGLERMRFSYDITRIPNNGIYVMFEKGETGHGIDRIVRVGTHVGDKQLRSRLNQHYVNENKDRSIFRKNIGRAILNKRSDSFLEQWNLDLTSREAKDKYKDVIDIDKLGRTEKEVSEYIQGNISFAVFEVKDKDTRLSLESKIISTISICNECQPSGNWHGLWSPKEKIRKSGLWLEQGLSKEPLSEADIDLLRVIGCKK
jgi:hypothetical protein